MTNNAGTNEGKGITPAPDPVECPSSPTGKHAPRTVEGMTAEGVHTKTSACHHCECVC